MAGWRQAVALAMTGEEIEALTALLPSWVTFDRGTGLRRPAHFRFAPKTNLPAEKFMAQQAGYLSRHDALGLQINNQAKNTHSQSDQRIFERHDRSNAENT